MAPRRNTRAESPEPSMASTGTDSTFLRCSVVKVDFGIHSGHQHQRGIGNVHLRLHRSRGLIHFIRKASDSAWKSSIQRGHAHVHRLAEVDQRNRGFRHRQRQPKQAVFGKPDHRHGLSLRGRSGLNQGAFIRVSLGHDAGKGRGNDGILIHRFEARLFGLRDADALLACGDVRFGGGDLRLGYQIARVDFVHFLLRHQPGFAFGTSRMRE